jgi:hypothetical protein
MLHHGHPPEGSVTLVLIGPHGVGKTRLGLALAALLPATFHEELGRRMAEDPTWRSGWATAADPQALFDDALFTAELARDEAWPADTLRIVETWHPGNLAYARLRSPQVADRHRHSVRAAVTAPVLVQPLVAPRCVLARRQSEPGDLDFFLRVGQLATDEARALGLCVLAPLATHLRPPADLARDVAHRLFMNPATSVALLPGVSP